MPKKEDGKEDVIEIPVGKYITAIRQNPWVVVSIVLFIALIVMFFWKASSAPTPEISEKEAAQNLISFINSQSRGNAEFISSTKVGSLYEIKVKFEGQKIPIHITTDGNFIVVNPIPISNKAPKLSQPEQVPSQNEVPSKNERVEVNIENSSSKGSKNAKVVIVEFTDYQCPYCKKYAQEAYPQIMKEYVNKGKVLYVVKDYPLTQMHPKAQKAAEAARCVKEQQGDVGYFRMHDKLFENQDSLSIENYKKWARQIGVLGPKFDSCLEDGKYAEEVEADLDYGQELGVTGTPSFFINGNPISGALPFDAFKQLIEQELNSSEQI